MIVLILILNLGISLTVLFSIRKGKIVKYSRLLKYINIAQIVSILLVLILFVFLMVDLYTAQPIINDGRALGLWTIFIYASLGIIVLIFNVVILLLNWFSKK
jgi:hypothetical protein